MLLALRDERGFSHDQLREGILTAAGLGHLIARNASVSGAEGALPGRGGKRGGHGGRGGRRACGRCPDRCLAAGANVMMSLLGLVCDPVGALWSALPEAQRHGGLRRASSAPRSPFPASRTSSASTRPWPSWTKWAGAFPPSCARRPSAASPRPLPLCASARDAG
ncbi:MAG: L-serine ammonia-lyase, iron-sulfur-dependent, subunit alpha [Adlercreutzia equolifaciens]